MDDTNVSISNIETAAISISFTPEVAAATIEAIYLAITNEATVNRGFPCPPNTLSSHHTVAAIEAAVAVTPRTLSTVDLKFTSNDGIVSTISTTATEDHSNEMNCNKIYVSVTHDQTQEVNQIMNQMAGMKNSMKNDIQIQKLFVSGIALSYKN